MSQSALQASCGCLRLLLRSLCLRLQRLQLCCH
jgi:hypothetical protein